MPLSTFPELKQAIRDWGKRSDCLSLLDTFIAMAESDMYAMPPPFESLRIRDMELTYSITLGASSTGDSMWEAGFWADGFWADGFWGEALEATRFIDLPSRFIEIRRIKLTTSCGDFWPDQKTPFNMKIRTGTGMPHYFTVTSQLELDVTPDQDYPLDILYFSALEPLSATNVTNAVLTRFPNIYLHGALRHFYLWAKNESMADYFTNQMAAAIIGANKRDHRGRYGPAPVIRMTGATP